MERHWSGSKVTSVIENNVCNITQLNQLHILYHVVSHRALYWANYLIMYTHDIPNCLTHSEVILFSNNTTVYSTLEDIPTLFNNVNLAIDALTEWWGGGGRVVSLKKMSLNVGETNYVVF